VDLTAPLSALPRLLLGTRHNWNKTEQLAAVLAEVADDSAGITTGDGG
jgi:hypothetical protein